MCVCAHPRHSPIFVLPSRKQLPLLLPALP